jgi:hypothetical protein
MREIMMRRVTEQALLAVALVFAGCTAVVPYEVAPTRTTIDNAYTIEPQVAWSAMRVGDDEIWTIDGWRLEFLRFVVAESGEPLFDVGDAGLKRRIPVYRSWMTPIEIREAIEKSFAALSYQQVQTIDFSQRILVRSAATAWTSPRLP